MSPVAASLHSSVAYSGIVVAVLFYFFFLFFFFFQAEAGIEVSCLSRGLGDVYKGRSGSTGICTFPEKDGALIINCLLYTSYAADELLCVELGGWPFIKKKKKKSKISVLTLSHRIYNHSSHLLYNISVIFHISI